MGISLDGVKMDLDELKGSSNDRESFIKHLDELRELIPKINAAPPSLERTLCKELAGVDILYLRTLVTFHELEPIVAPSVGVHICLFKSFLDKYQG